MTFIEDALAHGLTQHRAGKFAEAKSVYESLLSQSHDPRINGAALSHLARLHLREHRFADARDAVNRALHINNDDGIALLTAAQLERQAGHPKTALALLQTRSPDHLPPALIHELGHCWHAVGEYRKAFLCFKEAKRRISFKDLDINREMLTRYMGRLARRYATEEAHTWTPTPSSDRPDPVFLIGFNESGVNALGRLLNTHPSLSLAREVSAMDGARRVLGQSDPDGLHAVSEDDILKARAKYFEVMDTVITPGTIPVDALPFNSLALGLVNRLFPDALILRCLRHPCEAVLQTFIKPYSLNSVTCHFDRLERTATAIMATHAVSQQIESALSMTVHPLRYEEFIADPQSTLSAIAQGLGLSPDVPAATPAMSSVDQWPKYRAEMSRWLDQLLSLADQMGYPAK